ncbi:hypothetical protein SLS56_001918 [Neofusicoccum ribis]|uniref:Uncharacterized protein n=1 Tax=Neofusicoccum ribis TaxID=45134 RepID=A0ABR3T6H8_9PEZI
MDVAAGLNLRDLGRLVQDQSEKEDLKMVSFILMKELSAKGVDQAILWPNHQPKVYLPIADSQEWTAGLQGFLDQFCASQGSESGVFYLNAFTADDWAFDETNARVVGLTEDRLTIIIPPPAARYIFFVDIPWGNILEVALNSKTRIDLTLKPTTDSWTYVVNAEPSSNIEAVIDFGSSDDAKDTLKCIQDKCRASPTSAQRLSSQLPRSSDGPILSADADEDEMELKPINPSAGGASAALRERRSRLTIGRGSQRPTARNPGGGPSQTGGTGEQSQQRAGRPSGPRHSLLSSDVNENDGLNGLNPERRVSQKEIHGRDTGQPGQQRNNREVSMSNVEKDDGVNGDGEEEDGKEEDGEVGQVLAAPQRNTTDGVGRDKQDKPARVTGPSPHSDASEKRSSLNKKFRPSLKTTTATPQPRTQPAKMEHSANNTKFFEVPSESPEASTSSEKPKKGGGTKPTRGRLRKGQSRGAMAPMSRDRKRKGAKEGISDDDGDFKVPPRLGPTVTDSNRVTRSAAARNSVVTSDNQDNSGKMSENIVRKPKKTGLSQEVAMEISSADESESSAENAEDGAVSTRQTKAPSRIPLKVEALTLTTNKNSHVDVFRKPRLGIVEFDRQGARNQGHHQVHHTPAPTTPFPKTYSSGKPKTKKGVFGELIDSEEQLSAKWSLESKVTGKRPAEAGVSQGREKRKSTSSLDEKQEKQYQPSASLRPKSKGPETLPEGSTSTKASPLWKPDDNTAPFGCPSSPLARQPSPHVLQSPDQSFEGGQNVREHTHVPEKPKRDSRDLSMFANAPDALATQKAGGQPSSPPLVEDRPASFMQDTQTPRPLVSKPPLNNMAAMGKYRAELDEENGQSAAPSFKSQPIPAFTETTEPPYLPYSFLTQNVIQQATPRVEHQAQPYIHQKLQLTAPRVSFNVESNLPQEPRLEKPKRITRLNREAPYKHKKHIFTINEAPDSPGIPRAHQRSQVQPKSVLSSNRKKVPEPPEADSKAITAHVPQKMLGISKSLQTPAHPPADPFNGATPTPEKGKNETHFMRKLRGKLEAKGVEPVEEPLKPNDGNFGHGQFADEEDPDRTLVEMLDDDIGMGLEDDRSSSEESSSFEEVPDELTEEMVWEASLKPHQRDMFDVLTRISRHFIRHLVDAETAIEDIVSDYDRDTTHLIEQMEVSHRKEYETQRKALAHARTRMSGALTHINDQITSSEKHARSTLVGHNWEEQPAESKRQISKLNGILNQMGRK